MKSLLPVLPAFLCLAVLPAADLRFSSPGTTTYGNWVTDVEAGPSTWAPGDTVRVKATLGVEAGHLANLAVDNLKVDGFALLVTAERTFDATGWIRLPSDEKMSTLITPTGIPIEGGAQAAITTRYGGLWRGPVDQLARIPITQATQSQGRYFVTFQLEQKLPADLPPGIYRLRLDYGITVNTTRYYSLQGKTFAARQQVTGYTVESHVYSMPFPASGTDRSGRYIDGSKIIPRLPFVLLNSYNSNGYRGAVAEEDLRQFRISSRNLIQDDIILPLYDTAGRVISYSLEPQFPTDTIEARSNIPWEYTNGEIAAEITAPDGKVTKVGPLPFVARNGQWPTTRNAALTSWRPTVYGQYVVKMHGRIVDIWGNSYYGSGTYRFWIANRMTMGTATFQGQSYAVGGRYGRDIGFAPAVPADVEVEAALYVNSDPSDVHRGWWAGKATPGGIFGAAQGAQNLVFDAPGEYEAHVLAKYADQKGNLWVCSMRHAGVVYPENSRIAAHGKKLYLGGKYLDRGETHNEGWYNTAEAFGALVHINFPWNQRDALLIASEGETANKIIPMLTYEWKDKPEPYNARMNTINTTNVQLKTSNGYSPHLYPEYITEWAYFYAAGPRPGFMSRFLVAEDGVFAPYWHTSPNSFGGQIGASNNGDMPGDIYRLIGGVVLRRPGETPEYAGYAASAFLLPKASHNNRIIEPGSEEILGPTGAKAHFFLVGTRPGMVYEVGAAYTPAVQIDPMVPANVRFTLRFPDGRVVNSTGQGDAGGSWSGTRSVLDVPGVYRYTLDADWNGTRGIMPGLPPEGGDLYVVDRPRPGAPQLKLDIPADSSFTPPDGIHIKGQSTAESVYFAAVIPGAVIDQGYLPVTNGKFDYYFDPKVINSRVQTYDIEHRVTGHAEIGDVVHLTFFSKERDTAGVSQHSFTRVIIRGNRVISAN